ncbi:Levodione reductase [Nymphaea thermarum]|nr:Levodione reductase [Nymphaea thermarum]
MGISGKRVLLTSNGDSVSRGIAYYLAKYGCRLVLMGDQGVLSQMAATITNDLKRTGAIQVVHLDMEDGREAVFDGAVDRAWNCFGQLDAFVNCYSYEGKIQEILKLSEEEFKKISAINFSAPWFLLKAVSKRIQTSNLGGSVVFLTSIVGAERGLYPGAAAYGSCLAGIHQLVKASALELGKYKIRVNAITRGLHPHDEYIVTEKEKKGKTAKDLMPLQRWLDAENDLGSTVLYLVSDDSRYMTGSINFVDGGQSIVRPRMRSFI